MPPTMRSNPTLPAITNGALRLVAQFTDKSASVMEWSLSYLTVTGAISSTLTEMAAFLVQWRFQNETNWAACLPVDAAITGYLVQDIRSGVTPTYVKLLSPTTPGTVTGAGLPSYVAACVRKSTDYKGQRGRGRLYLGPVPVSFVTPATNPNLLNAGAVTAYNAFIAGLIAAVPIGGGRTWAPAVTGSPVAPATLVTTGAEVSSMALDTQLATIRRRKLFRGR